MLVALAVALVSSASAWAGEESVAGLTGAELGKKHKDMAAKGWYITEVKGSEENGVSKYSATWKDGKAPAYVWYYGLTDDQFKDHNADLPLAGFKLSDHSSWKIDGKTLHAAIWTK